MKLKQSQVGASLYSVAFILLIIGFTVFVGLKLFPVYTENFSVGSSLESIMQDRGAEYRSASQVRMAVFRHFELNNVHQVPKDDISVVLENDVYLIDIDYEVRIPFMKNIDLVISFTNHGEVHAS